MKGSQYDGEGIHNRNEVVQRRQLRGCCFLLVEPHCHSTMPPYTEDVLLQRGGSILAKWGSLIWLYEQQQLGLGEIRHRQLGVYLKLLSHFISHRHHPKALMIVVVLINGFPNSRRKVANVMSSSSNAAACCKSSTLTLGLPLETSYLRDRLQM